MFCPPVASSFIPFVVKLLAIILNCSLFVYSPIACERPESYVSKWKQRFHTGVYRFH